MVDGRGELASAPMTTTSEAIEAGVSARAPRRVAVMPAYNEEATIISVLERLEPLADQLVVVDDGSTDRTRELVIAWADGRPHVRLICFNQNRGMSAAYYRAFEEVARNQSTGALSSDDVVLTIDADGQHDPEEVDELVEHLKRNRLDAVIARRDFGLYTRYKRAGNFIMSLWASLWAGKRLYDVESGYRAFRVGALLAALRYYKGYKYSETVEVAVILARLGYRVDNNYLVPVPIFRSRTRLKDVAIDLAAIPAAAWRLETRRHVPAGVPGALVYYVPLIGPILLALMALGVLAHPLFLANDSMEHYSHVWYIAQQLFHQGRLPLHVALLDGGRATTFPYGFVPYLVSAALYPLLGDWAVTLLMVLGVLALVWSAGLARPSMRNPWLLLIFVANPFFIDALFSFQFASVWSATFFLLFVWAFERDRKAFAALLFWLSVGTHPQMGGAAMAGYAFYLTVGQQHRLKSFVVIGALMALPLAPLVWMTLGTPVAHDNSVVTLVLSSFDSVTRRGTILLLPFVLNVPALRDFVLRRYLSVMTGICGLCVLGLGFSMGVVRIGDMNRGSYFGVTHSAADIYTSFFDSPSFSPGSVYRVVEPTEREDGAYRFMQHGAVLGNDFFTESYQRRNWTEAQFACYARAASLQFDVIETAYTSRYRHNEGALLQSLASSGKASVAYSDPAGRFTVYDIRGLSNLSGPAPSVRECGL
ncbi:MAG TPA: glycosyltransferase [Dehalococcoidia bacterium]|nr:glycosyltransferase [Dehalococcoidia bacterium]